MRFPSLQHVTGLEHGVLRDNRALGGDADLHFLLGAEGTADDRVAADPAVLSQDGMTDDGTGFDDHTGHNHGILHNGILADVAAGGNDGVNLDHLTPGLAVFVFFAGVIAISAMVLPGISGSTLLLIFGLYLPVITAIKDMLHLDFSSFWTVLIFGCGVLVGIFSVVKLIRMALEKYRAQTIYLIIGLMLGSIFAVVMGPTTLDTPQPAMGIHDFSILFFLIGGAVILGLQTMKDIKQ